VLITGPADFEATYRPSGTLVLGMIDYLNEMVDSFWLLGRKLRSGTSNDAGAVSFYESVIHAISSSRSRKKNKIKVRQAAENLKLDLFIYSQSPQEEANHIPSQDLLRTPAHN